METITVRREVMADSLTRITRAYNTELNRVVAQGTDTGAVITTALGKMKYGGTLHICAGIYPVATKIVIPKDKAFIIEGEGAPSIAPDIYSNSGTILESNDSTGMLYVAGPPTSGSNSYVLLRDIEFRQNVNMTKSAYCVSLDGARSGGIERCNVFNVNARSGVAYPMSGCALSMKNGSDGDKYWAKDVSVGGMGGPDTDPTPYGLWAIETNHFVIENFHVNAMQKEVLCGMFIAAPGARGVLRSGSFFQLGDATGGCYIIDFGQKAAGLPTLLMEDITVESYAPINTQKAGIRNYWADNVRCTIHRAVNIGCTTLNPFRCNQPEGVTIKGPFANFASGVDCPSNFVTNFVDTTNYLISPNPVGTPGASLTSATDYKCELRSCLIYMAGGTVSEVKVAGVAVPYDSNLSVYKLMPGNTFKITYTVTPTSLQCFFEE